MEVAVIVPDSMEIALTNDPLAFEFITQRAGEYQYGYEDGRPSAYFR